MPEAIVMVHFEGDKEFALSAGDLWLKLSDPCFLVRCLPDVESISRVEADLAEFKLRPGLSFVRGTLDVTMCRGECVQEQSVRFALEGKGIGSTSKVQAILTLHPKEKGTHIHWGVDITELGGLLKAVPQGLIKASAQKVITDIWAAVEKKLAEINNQ
jgi:carbon monoxide dehydrogenase subunit G